MRKRFEIQADIEALGFPTARWGTFAVVRDSMAERLAWREANPQASVMLERHYAELDAVDRADRELRDLEALERQLREAGVGERSSETAANPDDKPALAQTREWLEGDKSWLLLGGDTGQGKTVAATWVLRRTAEQGRSIALRRAGEVTKLSAYDDGAKQLEHLKRVSMLVLDDIGAEAATAWGQSVLHELLDTRHEAKRRTVITGNFKRADARARLGDRLADRILQSGTVIWLEGESLRRRA